MRGKRRPYKRGADYVSKQDLARVLHGLDWSAELEIKQQEGENLLVPACPVCFASQIAGHEAGCELGRCMRGVAHLL
jgi:hypothetical protein